MGKVSNCSGRGGIRPRSWGLKAKRRGLYLVLQVPGSQAEPWQCTQVDVHWSVWWCGAWTAWGCKDLHRLLQ